MGYFTNLPNIYVGEGVSDEESLKYRLVKNIFRRVKARDDLNRYTTLFESYSIKPGETPSSLAYKAYGDPELDWCILLVNNIIDVYEEWPKSEDELLEYVNSNYPDPDSVHHYETQEVLYNGFVYYKEGIEVTEDFRITMPDGTVLSENESIYPVSNYEHETFLNEQKRIITLPKSAMVDLMVAEFPDLVGYESNPELDSLGNKKTPVDLSSRFISSVGGYAAGSVSVTSEIGPVTSFDYGPINTSSTATAGVVTSTTTSSTSSSSSASSSSSSGSSGSSGGSGY